MSEQNKPLCNCPICKCRPKHCEVLEIEICETEIFEAAYEINEDNGWCIHEPKEFIKGAKWAISELKKRGAI